MQFRPCIDIHNGKVKQIVGGSLSDRGNQAEENFVSQKGADFYASYYREQGLQGGHIILLNAKDSEYYEDTKKQAMKALHTYPNGLQIGGGITVENAKEYLDAGASHVIVTSYVFKNGCINYENLHKIVDAIGKEKLVLDLSCRKKEGSYYIVTDRWQTYTDVKLEEKTLDELANFCDEFLIHAVDVEGKANGMETEVVKLLGNWGKIPITYAGGIHNMQDLQLLKEAGNGKVDFTIGSALDLFGGTMCLEEVLTQFHRR